MSVETKRIYKNVSESAQELIGVGVIQSGETVETSAIINNGNFELVEKPLTETKPKAEATKQPVKEFKKS